ncbi:polymorphic toxin type 25 domain-containing protein, partial [Staphylococcus haemolyticus]|uniref:polymorphic toxin type 25 domain-containing protein n=1 Tax=Staphylococcus haemolyticus TaxID=1283 RepID=UPI001C5CA1E2
FANTLDMERNNSLDFGFGIAGVGISYGKDGVGLSLGVGPAIDWTGISKETGVGNVDINGSYGTEFYHYDFEKK